MWKEYNPNPAAKRVGDCTVRAITKATGKDWDKVYAGIILHGYSLCDMPSATMYGARIFAQVVLSGMSYRTIAPIVTRWQISAEIIRMALTYSQ